MPVIRTPEERFRDLLGFPFQPHYVEVNGMRVHYVDEGKGEVILCLHGEPSWSYLYRKMLPTLSQNHRVIAMDFIGFGRSDKYTERSEYSFQMHCETLASFIQALSLSSNRRCRPFSPGGQGRGNNATHRRFHRSHTFKNTLKDNGAE